MKPNGALDWNDPIGVPKVTTPPPVIDLPEWDGKPNGDFFTPTSVISNTPDNNPSFDTSFESISDICQKDLPPIKYFVDGMLSAGFAILAGNPKVGKSWLVQQLAVCIATGKPFLDHKTTRTGVLYLDLEGTEQRTKERALKQDFDLPNNVFISYRCKMLDGEPVTMKNNNLIEYLKRVLIEIEALHGVKVQLIIIDTLIKVKGGEKRGLNSYENDSKIFGNLQDFARSRGLCIVGVTHLTKPDKYFQGTDWTERVTGSMGLVGVGDNIIGLFKKGRGENEREALFRVSGRDVEEIDLLVNHNRDNCRWDLISNNVKQYEAETHPFFKYLVAVGDLSGTAGNIIPGYLEYCRAKNLFPRMETTGQDGKPLDSATLCMRFSKMIKKIGDDLPLINYELHCKDTNKGRVYSFEKHQDNPELLPW